MSCAHIHFVWDTRTKFYQTMHRAHEATFVPQSMYGPRDLADFQLIQVDGIYADNEENVKSYMRIGAADITLSEEPYGAHIQDNIDLKLRSKYHNLCSKPVMYGTKWGLNTNKYATHVPFGSLKYGSILFMTIDTVLTEDSDRNKLQDVVVDGDIYGVTFRYGVPSSWLFVSLILY